jgi:hypothetical protein
MKKNYLLVFIIALLLILPSLDAQIRIKNRRSLATAVTPGFKLKAPANNWQFHKFPKDIKFVWNHQPGYPTYSIKLEYWDKGIWRDYVSKSSLTKPYTVIRYAMNKGFRWRVICNYKNGQKLVSAWSHAKYVPGARAVNTKLTPQFHPVQVSPVGNKTFRNFPRNITFKWLHSTKNLYRRYLIQVDIYHPRPRKWQSNMNKGKGLLVSEITRNNYFNYRFPADRKGRWRVRGVKNAKQFTPWSGWKYFQFRARH